MSDKVDTFGNFQCVTEQFARFFETQLDGLERNFQNKLKKLHDITEANKLTIDDCAPYPHFYI